MKYRKKLVIEAVQLRWDTWTEVCAFAGMGSLAVGSLAVGKPSGGYTADGTGTTVQDTPVTNAHVMALAIPTLEGLMVAREGDWICPRGQGRAVPVQARHLRGHLRARGTGATDDRSARGDGAGPGTGEGSGHLACTHRP